MKQKFNVETNITTSDLQKKLNQWRHDGMVIVHAVSFLSDSHVSAVVEVRVKEKDENVRFHVRGGEPIVSAAKPAWEE